MYNVSWSSWIFYVFVGQEKYIEVLPSEDLETEADEQMVEDQIEPTLESISLPKMKLFSGKTAPGLRIRKAPHLTVSSISD